MKKIKAVIFDMDGVVSDTQKFHGEIESQLLKDFGIDMKPEKITKNYAGVSDELMFGELFQKEGLSLDLIPKIIRKKWELMGKNTNGKIAAIPHAIALIHKLKENGFKLAIASASTKTFILEVINSLELADCFDVLVSTYDVKKGKPAPDIFLYAAKRLGVKPEESIVIEDGRSGMIGAKVANMKCIGLVDDLDEDYPATKIVSSLKDIKISMIHNL